MAPDGRLRFVSTLSNDLRAEDTATGAVRWTLQPRPFPTRWRVLVSNDGLSVYVQMVADNSPTYLGTQRINARTGMKLADDIKNEIYWYENVVLWTALTRAGEPQMAIARASAAGGGYRLRTLDPLTLMVRTDITQTTVPQPPGS